MNKIWLITKKVFQKAVYNKAFIIITIIGPFLIAGIVLLQSLAITSDDKDVLEKNRNIKVINIYDEFSKKLKTSENKINTHFIDSKQTKEHLNGEVQSGKIDAYIEFPKINSKTDLLKDFEYMYYSKNDSMFFDKILEDYIGELIITERLKYSNLNELEIKETVRHPGFKSIKITEKGQDKEQDMSAVFTLIGFILILYMSIIFYGQAIGRSVVEEKTSKTVEIMLSSVKPSEMMIGKILGLGITGLLQYAIWIGMGYLIMNYIIPLIGISQSIISIDMSNFGFMFLFFILAYFFYSSGFAAIGAASIDTHNMGQLSITLMIPLIIAITSISALIGNPDGSYIVFLSYFPFTSPIIMFGRTLISNPSYFEILISIAILIVSTILMVFISTKIFRVGILMTGKKVKFNEIIKWLSYR